MCKAACKKHCDNEAIGIKCAGMDCLGLERTAQHAPAVKIPVGMRGEYTLEMRKGDQWVKVGTISDMQAIDLMHAEMNDGKPFEASAVFGDDVNKAIADLPTYPHPEDPVASAYGCDASTLVGSAVIEIKPAPMPNIQAAHESSLRQNAMHEACVIASALASESREADDPEPLAALMRNVGTQEDATLQLLKLVGRIGLRNWFDGDFVVLSKAEAESVANAMYWATADKVAVDILAAAIERAKQ